MTERRLEAQLVAGFNRTVWGAVAGYALLVIVVFGAVSEFGLRRSLEHTADVIESLLGLYADPAGEPTTVAPAMLADQLVGMTHAFAITREAGADDMRELYFLSPDMPARRIEGIGPASPDAMRDLLLAEISDRARWRYVMLHRKSDSFDIYVVASRATLAAGLLLLLTAAAILVPVTALLARRRARRSVQAALSPLRQVGATMRAIGPEELDLRVDTPTGQAEVTELADSVNRMLERVERAHQALDAFTGDASHELRTPLTHIRAQAQWAQAEGRSGVEMREALGAIEKEIERTNKMVEDLLLIARGENGQLSVDRRPFDLTEVAAEVYEIAVAMSESRELEIKGDMNGPLQVVGDPDRTRHVLFNLISNAVRYTAEGAVSIAVRRTNDLGGVEVRDTGPGIGPEHTERIFDRFCRLEASRSRAHGGAGLGLTIARLLAELQSGRITVESHPGSGSTFTLWLPVADVGDGVHDSSTATAAKLA
jgi:signal transduction histidine kinase